MAYIRSGLTDVIQSNHPMRVAMRKNLSRLLLRRFNDIMAS